jgi:polysaccharide export outer membrane protein
MRSWIGDIGKRRGAIAKTRRLRATAAAISIVAVATIVWTARTVCSQGDVVPQARISTAVNDSAEHAQAGDPIQPYKLAPVVSMLTPNWPDSLIETINAAQLGRNPIELCQALAPAQPEAVIGRPVAPIYGGLPAPPMGFGPCDGCPECARMGAYGPYPPCEPWRPGDWGEYVEHARLAHCPVYRLRVDDQLRCVYRVTRNEQTKPYELNVGDEIQVESFTDPNLNRSVIIQPDGSITLRLLGQVKAGHLTVAELNERLEKDYTKFYKQPSITVTPLRVNTKLLDLIATVDARAGTGGEGINVTVTPDGTISLPAIGPVPVQGMTLDDLKREIDARYATEIEGVEVTPILVLRAPRFVYVLGEVHLPGRFALEGPTTVMQALSMAGSWNVGANIKQIVIFRRSDDWRLMATMVDLHAALGGKNPCPAGEIWLGDSDVVLVPKSEILKTDDFINLVFTRGIYGVFPFTTSFQWSRVGVLH